MDHTMTGPTEGTITVRADGTVWRWATGQWDPVEPLRRRAWDVAVLNREFGGRYVCASNPRTGRTIGTFADRFRNGYMRYEDGHEFPLDPTCYLVHDPVGRGLLIDRLLAEGVTLGRAEIIGQLRRSVVSRETRLRAAEAADDEDMARAAHARWEAVRYELDLATGIVPAVTPTTLGVTEP